MRLDTATSTTGRRTNHRVSHGSPTPPPNCWHVSRTHLLEDRRSVFVGTGLPMIAAMLAQKNMPPVC